MSDDSPSADVSHPIREGAILRRRHEEERTEVLLEVIGRLEDIDDGHIEYRLACPTHTGYYRYAAEDLEDCFVDTGLTNHGGKPVADQEIRRLYQELHDEHGEHSFTTVHDDNTKEPVGEQCLHCGKMQGVSDRIVDEPTEADSA